VAAINDMHYMRKHKVSLLSSAAAKVNLKVMSHSELSGIVSDLAARVPLTKTVTVQ